MSFYEALREDSTGVYDAYQSWSTDAATYYEVRAMRPGELTSHQRAGRFLYLNRNSFNGVYRTNRRGEFNVPMGRRTGAPITAEELQSCGAALKDVSLITGDYRTTLLEARAGDFVYVDPPYTNSARPTYGEYGYGSFGSDQDVVAFGEQLKSLSEQGVFVLLSFGSSEGLEEALSEWTVTNVNVRRSIAASTGARRANDKEIIAWNY